jgi:hypothetical protein
MTAIKKTISGTGITEREIYNLEIIPETLPTDDKRALQDQVEQLLKDTDFSTRLHSLEQRAKRVLDDAGLPSTVPYTFTPDGEWLPISNRENVTPEGNGLARPYGISNRIARWTECNGFEPDSAEGYAARILDRILLIRACLETGNSEQACSESINLGELLREVSIKANWECDALHGRKKADALRASSAARNKAHHIERSNVWSEWSALAAKIWKDRPALSKNAVARLIKKRLRLTGPGTAIRTIVAHIKKPCEAG